MWEAMTVDVETFLRPTTDGDQYIVYGEGATRDELQVNQRWIAALPEDFAEVRR